MGSLDATSEPPPAASEDKETVDSPPLPDNASDAFETVVDSSSASSAEDIASNRKLLSFDSCSSSSDATFEDPFQDSGNEHHKPSLKFVATDHGEEPDGASESPPVQVMERPAAKYRIPSSVFARKKSAGPVDWSMASNESLFSIHGMSFCNPDAMLWNSGELGIQFSHSPENQFSGGGAKEEWKSIELDKTGKGHESGEADEIHESGKMNHDRGSTVAEKPASPVLNDGKEDEGSKTSAVDGRVSFYSTESGTSKQSFAFPILADKNHPAGNGVSTEGTPEKAKAEPEQEPPPSPPQSLPESPPSEPKTGTPRANPGTGTPWANWVPCFRCCTFTS